MVTPTNDQDRLIDQALSLLRNAMAETKTVLPVVQFRPAEPKALLPSSVQEERAASLVNQTLPMVENIAVSEAPSPSLQQPVAKQASKEVVPTEPPVQKERKASLIAQALSMVKSVATAEPKPVEVAPSSFQQPVAKKTSIEVPIDQALSKVAVAESTVAEAPSS